MRTLLLLLAGTMAATAEQARLTTAEEFAAKARKHEAAAERIRAERGYSAMRHKWPAMALGAENAERDRAEAARRAEAEARARETAAKP